jgi:hypothetical protein
VALYDRLDLRLNDDPNLKQLMWRQREIENYLCQRAVLLGYAKRLGSAQLGELYAGGAESQMDAAIAEVSKALRTLGKPDPFGSELKVSDEFLDPVFRAFFRKMDLPEGTMRKTDYHTLAPLLAREEIASEVVEKLDAIVKVAEQAGKAGG